jgi:hypothetical protein
MAKRCGNPNWGKSEAVGPVVVSATSFERVVEEFKLAPQEFVRSVQLREWGAQ